MTLTAVCAMVFLIFARLTLPVLKIRDGGPAQGNSLAQDFLQYAAQL
jgi:hypothetical protein